MLIRAFSAFALLFAVAQAAEAPLLDVSLSLRRSTAGDYVFVVRNSGAKPVLYIGYGGSETAPPIFSVEILQDGQWKSAPLGWCGTGLGQSFLRAHGDFTQPIHPGISFEIQASDKFRVSMTFSSERYAPDKKPDSVTIYSNLIAFIPPREKKG